MGAKHRICANFKDENGRGEDGTFFSHRDCFLAFHHVLSLSPFSTGLKSSLEALVLAQFYTTDDILMIVLSHLARGIKTFYNSLCCSRQLNLEPKCLKILIRIP